MNRSLSVLVYGSSKAGKSSFSVTGPTPRVYFDVESASRFLPIKPILWDPSTEAPPKYDGTWDTAVVATRDWATVERGYQWLASGQHPFESLVIDSISELQNRFMETQAGRQQPTMQQWGSAYRIVSGLVRDLRDLTMHPTKPLQSVVITAMARQIDGMWRPWCQGQLQTVLPYLLDVTGYIWVEQEADELSGTTKEVRKLLTRRTTQFEAGERVDGRIPAVVQVQTRASGQAGTDVSEMLDMIFGRPTERAVVEATLSATQPTQPTTTPTDTEETT